MENRSDLSGFNGTIVFAGEYPSLDRLIAGKDAAARAGFNTRLFTAMTV